MPLITDTLTDITGEITEYASIMVRSEVRAGSTSLITPETEEIPVVEGEVSFHAEPGAGVLILRREKNQYSRQEIIPIWVPEYDTTLREVIQLGKTHTNTDGDTATDLVEQFLSTITGAVAEGLAQIEEATSGIIIGDDGLTVDLSEYATIVYVDELIEQIELTTGKDGKPGASAYEVWLSAGNTGTETVFLSSLKGEDGQDGQPGKPGASAYEVWIAAGNTGTEAEFISSLKGEDGQDGKDGKDGLSPHIDQTTGNWFIGTVDTVVKAQGQDGDDGEDGLSPHIEQTTGNWHIGDTDTGVKARGQDGKDGKDGDPLTVTSTTETQEGVELSLSDGTTVMIPRGPKGNPGQDGVTPHIDQVSGNWYLGDQDTGIEAQGPKGDPGPPGVVDPGDIRPAVVDILNLDMSNLYIDGNSAVTAQNQLRAALSVRGLSYITVEEIPFDIKLLGVTNLTNLFRDMGKLRKAPLLNTSGVTSMQSMFNGCSSLTEVPPFDTSSVTTMGSMFRGCYSLTEVPHLDTSSVTTMASMFNGCEDLNFVPDTHPIVCTNFSSMFSGCSQLTDGNVKLFDAPINRSTLSMISGSGLTKEPFYTSA